MVKKFFWVERVIWVEKCFWAENIFSVIKIVWVEKLLFSKNTKNVPEINGNYHTFETSLKGEATPSNEGVPNRNCFW